MIKSRILLAGALLAVAGVASADITVTPAVVWDYDFRGVSQTAGDPAVQAGITYTHASGAYVGAWASNVQFGPGDPNIEMDFFGGFAGGDATKSVAYDVGIIYYTYVISPEGLGFGPGFVLGLPFLYAGLGFAFTALACVCYNMLARTLGGIEIDLADGSPS